MMTFSIMQRLGEERSHSKEFDDQSLARLSQVSVNLRWGGQKSTMAGAYILAVASKLLARTGSQEVLQWKKHLIEAGFKLMICFRWLRF